MPRWACRIVTGRHSQRHRHGNLMQYRELGNTGIQLSQLGYGASSLGQEFRRIDLGDALQSVRTALDLGMNFIDTSPYYGRGMSETMLGIALRDVPRDSYYLGTKLGRYAPNHFDFSPARVVESVDISLERLGTDHVDVMLCHDVEFADLDRIVEETIPALRNEQQKGKIRFIGISGYPMETFRVVLERAELDVILSYNHYTLQNDMLTELVPLCRERGVGIINAAPFAARLLTNSELPDWHKATDEVRRVARQAAEHAASRGADIAQLALQFSVSNPDFATCIVGSANPANVKRLVEWVDAPVDEELMHEVREMLQPIHNWYHQEGRPENNDEPR
jgi:aryl-alcohol dehydrogenase-like predicted oxidoreductase